jgi:hypothetical protein
MRTMAAESAAPYSNPAHAHENTKFNRVQPAHRREAIRSRRPNRGKAHPAHANPIGLIDCAHSPQKIALSLCNSTSQPAQCAGQTS